MPRRTKNSNADGGAKPKLTVSQSLLNKPVPKKNALAESEKLSKALAAARALRPDRASTFVDIEAKLKLHDSVASDALLKKRKQLSEGSIGDDLFSADAIAQAIKKQRVATNRSVLNPTDGSVIKMSASTGKVITQPSTQKRVKSDRFSGKKGSTVVDVSDSSDSDDDDGDSMNDTEAEQFSQFLMQDSAAKDQFEDADDVNEKGDALVSLSKDVMSVFGVRTQFDDIMDKTEAKQAHDQYERKKKVLVKLDDQGRKIHVEEPGRLDRTLFLSNVHNTVKPTDIKKFLEGIPIESIRFRSAGFESTHLPHWVLFAKKSFHEKRDTLCVYVVLKSSDDIQKALSKNQKELVGKHVRVDLAASEGKADPKRSIFIGNLPFDITEESLYQLYAPIGELEAVRCIRDSKTGMGKGFAIVTFMTKDVLPKALKTHGSKPEHIGRNLRVVRVAENAFEKSASFRADQMRAKMQLAKQKATRLTRSERMKQDVLGKDAKVGDKKSGKIQGAYQKLFGDSGGVTHAKKPRHEPRALSSAPSWMGTRAKPTDNLGRNKATKGKDGKKKTGTKPKPRRK